MGLSLDWYQLLQLMVQGLISKYGKTSIYLKSKDFVYYKRIGLNDRYRQCLWLIWMFYPRWTLMWKDNVKFAVFFQNMHDTLGSKCKHGVKEVANSVIVCSSIQADFLHITRLIVWCSSPKKVFCSAWLDGSFMSSPLLLPVSVHVISYM